MKKYLICYLFSMAAFSFGGENPNHPTVVAITNIKIDWDRVNQTGFVKELINDADFLALPLDLTEHGGRVSLNQIRQLLRIPIVKNNLSLFVTEVVLGTSNLEFRFNDKEYYLVIEQFLRPLIEQKEYLVAQSLIKGVASDQLSLMKFNSIYASILKENTISTNVALLIEEIAKLENFLIVHTTKGSLETVVPGFDGFLAGRFGISFKDSRGKDRYLVVETESLVGHLQPVVPGKTVVEGYVAEATDSGFMTVGAPFSKGELKSLIASLVYKWGKGDAASVTEKDRRQLLSAVGAIYSNGNQKELEEVASMLASGCCSNHFAQ